jgi:ABC-2 type transport system permease protein
MTSPRIAQHPPASPHQGGFLLAAASLWHREVIRFLRQPSRIAGLIAAPLLFWFFIGSGLGSSFRPPATDASGGYLQYFFPGTVVMIVLFTSVFSNMSTIEDRREGFLLSVLVAPIPRASLVAGKILGGTTQALVPGLLFLLAAPLVGFRIGAGQAVAALGVLFLIALSLTSLGFAIAWRMDSVQGFHAVLNLVLMPLWLLSGALFPASGASDWLRWVMRANPLTYEVAALRQTLASSGTMLDGLAVSGSLEVTALFSLACLLVALAATARSSVRSFG